MEDLEKLKEEKKKLDDLEIMTRYQGEDRIITSKEAWKDLEAIRSVPTVKFMSKVSKLDNMIDGFDQYMIPPDMVGDLIDLTLIKKIELTDINNTAAYKIRTGKQVWFLQSKHVQYFLIQDRIQKFLST